MWCFSPLPLPIVLTFISSSPLWDNLFIIASNLENSFTNYFALLWVHLTSNWSFLPIRYLSRVKMIETKGFQKKCAFMTKVVITMVRQIPFPWLHRRMYEWHYTMIKGELFCWGSIFSRESCFHYTNIVCNMKSCTTWVSPEWVFNRIIFSICETIHSSKPMSPCVG